MAGAWGLLGTQRYIFLFSLMCLHNQLSQAMIPPWATGLQHSLLALLDLVSFIQAGISESGVLLALHTDTQLSRLK